MADNALAAILLANQRKQYDPAERSRAFAQQLMKEGSSTAPVQSGLEGLARALQGGVGGFFAGQADRAEKEKQRATTTGLFEYANAKTPEQQAAAQAKLGDLDPSIAAAIATTLIGRNQQTAAFNALPTLGGTTPPGLGGGQPGPLTIDIQPLPPPATGRTADQQDAFIQMMSPGARQSAQQLGVDPRLALAQTALETGYGKSAPGNNYFGVKGPGQVLATTEAGDNGQLVPTQSSFRTYPDAAASAQGYTDLLKNDPRYAGVLQAKGLNAQIDAVAKAGYATDPNYAQKVGAIANTLAPTDPTDPMTPFSPVRASTTAGGTPIDPNAKPPGFMQPQAVTVQATPPAASATQPTNTPEISPQAMELQRMAQAAAKGGNAEEALVLQKKALEAQATYVQERAKTADTRTYEATEHDRRKAAEEASKPLTESQAKDAGYYSRMRNAAGTIDQFEAGGKAPSLGSTMTKNIPGIGAMTQTPRNQAYNAAKLDWISSQLRMETGANMPATEVAEMEKRYFPQPGEGPEIIKQKAQAREVAEEAMKTGAGSNYKHVPKTPMPLPGGAPVKVSSPEEARRLRSGTQIELPDGSIGVVP